MREIPIKISYHSQRSSTGRIRDGGIRLRISSLVSRREQERHIEHLRSQLEEKWDEEGGALTSLNLRSVLPEGELYLSTGVYYQVRTRRAEVRSYQVQKIGRQLVISQPVDREFDAGLAEEALWKFLMQDQVPFLKMHLDALAEEWMEERCSKVRMRMAMSRWGSCDRRSRVIMLSAKLLLVEPKLLDYVCVHELAHLRYADHSDLFWYLVSEKMPQWKVLRQRLRGYE